MLLVLQVMAGNAQSGKVLVQNEDKGGLAGLPAIQIKWYSQALLYPSGVNVYRREKGERNWVKLNNAPVMKKAGLPQDAYQQDENLELFVSLVNEAKPSDLQGFVLLNIMIKSFESDLYSGFLGINYLDQQPLKGKAYQYKISKIAGSGEELIGISDFITAGKYEPEAPVKEVKVEVNKLTAEISWKPEDDRFYGVNIYRSSSSQPVAVKVNNRPVMISQSAEGSKTQKLPEVLYVDDSLQENEKYTYYLAGVGFFGKETAPSPAFTVTVSDVSPPPAPVNLKETIENPKVILNWENQLVADLSGTNVYRRPTSDGPFEKINKEVLPPPVVSFTDETPGSGGYYYYVASVDTAGNEAPSVKVFAEIHDISPPSKPEGLTAEADTGRIILKWKQNPEADLMGYLLFRTVDSNDKENFVLLNADPVITNQYTERLPFNAKNKFLYKVIAIDKAYNRSEPSEVAAVRMPDILPPEKPFIKTLREENENLVIEWTPNTDEDLLGYHVYRATGADSAVFNRLNIKLLAPGSFRYTDRSAEAGTDYFYTLQAVDSSGNTSAQSNIYAGRRTAPEREREEFTSAKAAFHKKKKEVTLSWKMAEGNELLGYVIYKGEGDESSLQPLTGLLKSAGHTDREVSGGKSYYYEIRAYFPTGEITKSSLLTVDIQE